ncbi:hypothetical protein OSTOST_07167, partial [Ostertagia ostertagi]
MCSIALRVTAFTMLLYLSQIQFCEVFVPGEQDETIPESYRPEIYKFDRNVAPALSCTFIMLQPGVLIRNIDTSGGPIPENINIEDCLNRCCTTLECHWASHYRSSDNATSESPNGEAADGKTYEGCLLNSVVLNISAMQFLVTPARSCTFIMLQPGAVIHNISGMFYYPGYKNIERCLDICCKNTNVSMGFVQLF